MKKPRVVVIGGGSSALFLCAYIDTEKYEVLLYEKTSQVGRKFLVAGNGGFNLTHGSDIEEMVSRYMPKNRLEEVLRKYPNTHMRSFLSELGIDTFVGSSNRVFPSGEIKPYEVLRALLALIKNKGVQIFTDHKWTGFDDENRLIINDDTVTYDHIVYALGGASWAKTGSDGSWSHIFKKMEVQVTPFSPSNAGIRTRWDDDILRLAGKPLKNIGVKIDQIYNRGEALITDYGLEGGAIYAMSRMIREELKKEDSTLLVDLKPDLTEDKIRKELDDRNSAITKTLRSKIHLSEVKIALLRALTSKEIYVDHTSLAHQIKNLPISIEGLAPIDEAISTVGGVSMEEVDCHFRLKNKPYIYMVGEMLDWDAITGGYLLQGCYSMSMEVADHLNQQVK